VTQDEPRRCGWVGAEAVYIAYHDEEWGVPQTDSRALFEKIVLEGFQTGLSWITVLRKREHFRKLFDKFDAAKMVRYTPAKIEALVADPGIIRHRGKIEAAVANAQALLGMQDKGLNLAHFLWGFVDGEALQNRPRTLKDVPAQTPLSQKISKELRGHGFKFVGPTTVYAMMQAVGLVNDHLTDCHRYEPCAQLKRPKL
jgi:DNA-3-methyladenine glycosylase I